MALVMFMFISEQLVCSTAKSSFAFKHFAAVSSAQLEAHCNMVGNYSAVLLVEDSFSTQSMKYRQILLAGHVYASVAMNLVQEQPRMSGLCVNIAYCQPLCL